jgi:hypothetical protein
MSQSVKIESARRAKNARFEVKRNRRVVKRKSVRRTILRTNQKKKGRQSRMTIHQAKEGKRRRKERKRNLSLHPHLLQLKEKQTCQPLKRFAALLI